MTNKIVGATPAGANYAITRNQVDGHDGGTVLRPKASGEQISAGFTASTSGGSAFASGAVFGSHIPITEPTSIDAMGIRVATSQASTNAKILLYSCDADNHPVTLVATGTVATTATGYVFGTTGTVNLTEGVYWATLRSDTGTTVRFQCLTNTYMSLVGTWSSTSTPMFVPTADVGTYASPNSTLSTWTYTTASTNSIPHVVLRLA